MSDHSATGYDRVEIDNPGGPPRRLTRKEFEALPLSERIGSLLSHKARFFLGDKPVESKAALAG